MIRSLAVQACFLLLLACCACSPSGISYTANNSPDGGYQLDVHYRKRHLKPITAEGMFPVESGSCTITVVGPGEDWSYKGRKGFAYSEATIRSDRQRWDVCWAWRDAERNLLHLNAYWLVPPDRMVASQVAGVYDLDRR